MSMSMSMSKQKIVRINCNFQSFDHVYIKFHIRKHPINELLFLENIKSIYHRINGDVMIARNEKQYIKKYEEAKKFYEEVMKELNWLEDILEKLKIGETVIDKKEFIFIDKVRRIFSPKELIDHKEAERMIGIYLDSIGIKSSNVKYKWKFNLWAYDFIYRQVILQINKERNNQI